VFVAEQPSPGTTTLPTINLVGKHLALGPLDPNLVATYQRWLNDFRMTRTIGQPVPYTCEQVEADYQQIGREPRQTDFTMYERATGRPIGNVAWRDIDWCNGTAEYVLFIGEADCRGKGYGTEVTRLMLDYAFTTLGLHNVMLRVYEYNRAGHHAYLKAGFRECGRRRQCKRLGDKLWDVIYMECLATEFTSATP
jgi:RimJ/RimL family protein N-acetyltransferase